MLSPQASIIHAVIRTGYISLFHPSFHPSPSLHHLFLNALLTQALLILSLQFGIDLSTLGGLVTMHLGLQRQSVMLPTRFNQGRYRYEMGHTGLVGSCLLSSASGF